MSLFFDLVYAGGVIAAYPALRIAGNGRCISAVAAALWPVALGMTLAGGARPASKDGEGADADPS